MTDENTSPTSNIVFLSISILVAAVIIACSIILSQTVFAPVSAPAEKEVSTAPVKNTLSNVASETRLVVNTAEGKFEKVYFPDGSSAIIEACPMTKKEQDRFGHVPCPEMSADELREAGCVEVDLANYTWCDDSVLDLTALTQMNNLHVEDGVYKDADGYVACFSRTNEMYSEVETPLGPGRVYDPATDWYTIGVFLSSK